MSTQQESAKSPELMTALCRELVRLARHEEELAANEAARVPYWRVCPPSVDGHRAAAAALRADLARLETQAREWERAS